MASFAKCLEIVSPKRIQGVRVAFYLCFYNNENSFRSVAFELYGHAVAHPIGHWYIKTREALTMSSLSFQAISCSLPCSFSSTVP